MRVLEYLMNKIFITFILIIVTLESFDTRDFKCYNYYEDSHLETTLDSIYYEINKLNLEHPEIVFSQVILETGYLTSKLYRENNNLFGMRVSGSRATMSNKIVNGYKWYPSWRESLIDYALLQMAFYKNKSEKEYFDKLSRVYAEDPYYVTKLKKIKNEKFRK